MELVSTIFTSVKPARQVLAENIHYFSVISPEDFEDEAHKMKWVGLRKKIIGKIRNVGSVRSPIVQLTVRNTTLEDVLSTLWSIYEDLNHRDCASAR